jgi:hypothetical protein
MVASRLDYVSHAVTKGNLAYANRLPDGGCQSNTNRNSNATFWYEIRASS